MVEPSQSTFGQDDSITLAKHLKVETRSSMRKREIQKLIMEHLVNDKRSFKQSALDAYKVTQDSSPEVELDHSNSVGHEREERQWQREQEEIAWQREREKREWEREREERQFKLKQQEIELQKLQLESQNKSSDHSTPYFDVTKHIRMVPPFQEREVDKYFLHFEKVAKNCNWPKESWTMLLQSIRLGKAREIFSQLTVEDSGEYDTVKQLILKGYELVPEAYRLKLKKETNIS